MNSIKTALTTLSTSCFYRTAIFTNTAAAAVADIAKMTDSGETSYISGSRIIIKENPSLQAKYAAKQACTPPGDDPCKGPYRTVTPAQMSKYTDADLNTLVSAGIVCDWIYRSPYDTSELVEPIRAVSTAFRSADGARPADANIHIRRNADDIWRQMDLIAANQLKSNDTETGITYVQELLTAFLESMVDAGRLKPKKTTPTDKGYFVRVDEDTADAFKLIITRKIRPINAVYFLDEPSTVQAPI
jgi:hypothetical protein